MNKLVAAAALLMLVLVPVLSFAQPERVPENVPGFTTASGFLGVMDRVINWIFTFLLILAVIFILYAAFKYLTAAGDPGTIATANKMLLYAAIAIAVAVLSRSIPILVKNFVGGGLS